MIVINIIENIFYNLHTRAQNSCWSTDIREILTLVLDKISGSFFIRIIAIIIINSTIKIIFIIISSQSLKYFIIHMQSSENGDLEGKTAFFHFPFTFQQYVCFCCGRNIILSNEKTTK